VCNFQARYLQTILKDTFLKAAEKGYKVIRKEIDNPKGVVEESGSLLEKKKRDSVHLMTRPGQAVKIKFRLVQFMLVLKTTL